MPFTNVTVTGHLENPDTGPAEGRVVFTLSKDLENGTAVAAATPVEAVLDAAGTFSVGLVATDDTGTTPTGATYHASVQVEKHSREFDFALPHAVSPVDITALWTV